MAVDREDTGTLYAGELEIRPGEGLVLAAGRPLTLSVREFELLTAMAERSGAVVTREELYGVVWGGELRASDRSVDVYVSKLRSKLEAVMPDRRFIHTHPGFGYRFQPQPHLSQANSHLSPAQPAVSQPQAALSQSQAAFSPAQPALSPAQPALSQQQSHLSRNVHNGDVEDW
jgi:DNA-binding winged helix-turn-helix (wHTH) protein